MEFTSGSIKTVVANLRRPGGREPGGEAGRTVPTSLFKFRTKVMLRLQNACDIMKYYETLRCDVSTDMSTYDSVVKNFKLEHDALVERKSLTVVTPRVSSNSNVVKWTESFLDLLSRLVGTWNMPLTCVLRKTIEFNCNEPLVLPAGYCHATESGSIEKEFITRASHDHPFCKDENTRIHFLLEEATRVVNHAASMKPCQKRKNRHDAQVSVKN